MLRLTLWNESDKLFRPFGLLMVSALICFAFETVTASEAITAGAGQEPSVVVYSVSVEPAEVASGETILIEAEFSVFGESDRSSLPMEYFCEIQKQGELVFKSPVRAMNVKNGAKSHLDVRVQATGGKGDYKVVLELIRPDGSIRKEGGFSIVSPMEARIYRTELLERNPSARSAVENRLIGKWEFVSQDPKAPGHELVISKENGELAAQVLKENAGTLWVKLRKTETNLIVRSKSATPAGGCWYVMEDVITFNERMDDLPVRSRVLEGSRCVCVGRVSESTLRRME